MELVIHLQDFASESSAGSVQAKKMGLISAGFGRYRTKEGGPITHKLEDGRLVKTGHSSTIPQRMNPSKVLDAVKTVCDKNRVHSKKEGNSISIEYGRGIEVTVKEKSIELVKHTAKGDKTKTFTEAKTVASALSKMFKASAARSLDRSKKAAAARRANA